MKKVMERRDNMPNLNISEMAQGAFMESFSRELDRCLKNIDDPNTDPKATRKVTLTAVLKPDENREIINFDVQCKSTIAPAKSLSTTVILDHDDKGNIAAAELKSGSKGQCYLDTDGQVKDDIGNVVSFNKK
jgi:hypothetical protein